MRICIQFRSSQANFPAFPRQILLPGLSYPGDHIVPPDRSSMSLLESLYREHGAALVLFAAVLTGDRDSGQDAIHRVFTKLLQEGSLGRARNLKAYLFACVRNAVLNEIKTRDRHIEIDAAAPWFISPAHDPAEEMTLRSALSELPEDQREIVVLHIWGELTFGEVAALLEVSPNTAASRYRYALTRLREVMRTKEETRASPR
jgi:RNA polymerase sigma-70 factor, ECF subfamily